MKNFKFVLLFNMIFCTLAYAQVSTAPQEAQNEAKLLARVHDGINTWSVTLSAAEGLEKLTIQEQRGQKIEFESDSVAHSFIKLTPLTFSRNSKLYFISIWTKGAHGQTIRVMDPEAKRAEDLVVFSYNSAWPLEYSYVNGELIIIGKGEMGADGSPVDEVRKFRP